jgi:hypothetical protein
MSKVATIVSVKWLAEKVAAPPKNFRILDGSWHLPSTGRVGKDEYAKEHVPGAQFFDIDECADPEATTLNHMLPKPAGKTFRRVKVVSSLLFTCYLGDCVSKDHVQTNNSIFGVRSSFPIVCLFCLTFMAIY